MIIGRRCGTGQRARGCRAPPPRPTSARGRRGRGSARRPPPRRPPGGRRAAAPTVAPVVRTSSTSRTRRPWTAAGRGTRNASRTLARRAAASRSVWGAVGRARTRARARTGTRQRAAHGAARSSAWLNPRSARRAGWSGTGTSPSAQSPGGAGRARGARLGQEPPERRRQDGPAAELQRVDRLPHPVAVRGDGAGERVGRRRPPARVARQRPAEPREGLAAHGAARPERRPAAPPSRGRRTGGGPGRPSGSRRPGRRPERRDRGRDRTSGRGARAIGGPPRGSRAQPAAALSSRSRRRWHSMQ